MDKIKYSATPKLEMRRDKNKNLILNKAPLLLDITYNGNRISLNVGFRIDATITEQNGKPYSKWDDKLKRAVANTVHYKGEKARKINSEITALLAKVDKTFETFYFAEVMPTITEFKKALSPKKEIVLETDRSKEHEFFKCFDEYVKRGKEKWQPNTLKKHSTTKKHLLEFDPKLTFEDLNDHSKIDEFVTYLNNEGLRNVSAEKYLKVLKWFLKWSVDNDLTEFKKFLTYKPSLENISKEVIFLTQSEFTHLYNLELKQDHLQRVRDVFCFSCVTGLRYSDIYNLKRYHIKDGKIHLTTIKTNDALKIDLNKYSTSILEKYKDFEFQDGKALPVISNQKTNEYLKKVCELAGFDERIEVNYKVGNTRKTENYPKHNLMSFHAGRRTFVCLGLFLGMTPKVIMSFTGHKSAAAMKPYEKIVEELQSKEMKKFDF